MRLGTCRCYMPNYRDRQLDSENANGSGLKCVHCGGSPMWCYDWTDPNRWFRVPQFPDHETAMTFPCFYCGEHPQRRENIVAIHEPGRVRYRVCCHHCGSEEVLRYDLTTETSSRYVLSGRCECDQCRALHYYLSTCGTDDEARERLRAESVFVRRDGIKVWTWTTKKEIPHRSSTPQYPPEKGLLAEFLKEHRDKYNL